ncbi:MAG: hypothetical protein IMX02_00325 [Limnochordaceae bacterium]|nr:hypothetical protein [Limnochordaceae bacterium]
MRRSGRLAIISLAWALALAAAILSTASGLVAEAAAPAGPPGSPPTNGARTPAPTPAGRGELVDMAFQKADVADVFQVLGELAGLNVLVDPSASGQVTFFLHRIPAMDAIDLVARASGLGYKIVDGTLIVAAPQRLQAQFAREAVATVALRYLAPADAERLVKTVVPGIQTVVDTRSSAIVMRGSEEDVARAKQLLARHDVAAIPELQFDAAPVATVLLALAKAGGMSLVVEGQLAGTVTLYLRPGTAVKDALDIVARQTGITYRIGEDDLLVVTPPGPQALQPQSAPAAQARAYELHFIPVETATGLLAAALPDVKAQSVPGTSVLMLQGTPAQMQRAEALLRSFDRPSVRVAGIMQVGEELRALVEIGGRSHVVREGSRVGPLVVTSITKEGVTLALDGQEIVAPAGGALR